MIKAAKTTSRNYRSPKLPLIHKPNITLFKGSMTKPGLGIIYF